MNPRRRYVSLAGVVTLLCVLAGLTACKQGGNGRVAEKPASPVPVLPAAPASPVATGSAPSQAAGVAWSAPAGWEVGPEREMRIVTYRIHAIAGDPEDAECAVYFFGTGQGGTVQANLDRWAHQFVSPGGKSPAPSAKVGKQVIGGLQVSTITVSGTYLGAGAMMAPEQATKSHFRMLGAIVEAPQGLVFFKLTGPLNTVAAAEKDFNSLLASLHRQ